MARANRSEERQTNGQQSDGAAPGSKSQVVSDETYALISVLCDAVQSADTHQQHIVDAERTGNDQLVEFVRHIQEDEQGRVERIKDFLLERARQEDEELLQSQEAH